MVRNVWLVTIDHAARQVMAFPRDKQKPAHHRGTYHVRSRALVAAAYADPSTRCWRCGNTLDQCEPHRNGKPARWTAGHLIDGLQDGPMAPECSPCNSQAGARLGNRIMRAKRRQRTNLTW
jgi:hypothetical protein